MHQIFSIPELVGGILSAPTADHKTICASLRVNRFFSDCAARILWSRCGGVPASADDKLPKVLDLASIASKDVQRAQYYANFIRELRFVDGCEEWNKEQWQSHLRDLKFPSLEHFLDDGSTTKNLRLIVSEPVERPPHDARPPNTQKQAGLFWHVLNNSPRMKTVDLSIFQPHKWNLMQEAAIKLITSTPALTKFRLKPWAHGSFQPAESEKFWPLDVLSSLTTLSDFTTLKGGKLSEKLLSQISSPLFSKLQVLETGYTGALSPLPSLFPHLEELRLEFQDVISGGLSPIASLSSLTKLTLEFSLLGESTVLGSDLLAIARGCPNLAVFRIPASSTLMNDEPCPQGSDISDETIEDLSRLLPGLKTFCLGIDDRSALTHKSVLSLAQNCRELAYLYITADVNLEAMVHGLEPTGETPLQNLKFMRLFNITEFEFEGGEDLAQRFARMAPQLLEFSIDPGEGAGDIEFRECIEESMAERRPPYDPYHIVGEDQ